MAGLTAPAAALLAVAAVTPVTDGAARAEVDRLVPLVAAARRLPFHGSLPVRPASREALQAELSTSVAGALAGPGLGAEAGFLRRLGLIPGAGDFTTLAARAYATATLPLYDVTSRRLLVPDFVPLDKQRIPLSHEIAHAVADQRFGIRQVLKIAPDSTRQLDGDAQRARLALVEGDAGLTVLVLADPRETFLGARELANLAASLRRAADEPGTPVWFGELGRFTHVDGLLFVARVRARNPWSAVDALWTDPPSSTAQVLHPERYDTCQEPVRVDDALLPPLTGMGRPRQTDVLGELVARAWLARALPPEIAERAAAGWAGDRAGLYATSPDGGQPSAEPGSRPGTPQEPMLRPMLEPMLWLTVWDTPAESDDFARAAEVAGARAVVRRGEAVALLLGEADGARAALERAVEGWQRQQAVSRRAGARPRPAAPPDCPRRDRAAVPR